MLSTNSLFFNYNPDPKDKSGFLHLKISINGEEPKRYLFNKQFTRDDYLLLNDLLTMQSGFRLSAISNVVDKPTVQRLFPNIHFENALIIMGISESGHITTDDGQQIKIIDNNELKFNYCNHSVVARLNRKETTITITPCNDVTKTDDLFYYFVQSESIPGYYEEINLVSYGEIVLGNSITIISVEPDDNRIQLSNQTLNLKNPHASIGDIIIMANQRRTYTYSVSDDRFEIINGQLKLKDGVTLDYEAEPSILIDITATDDTGLSFTKSNILIQVQDIYENVAPTQILLSNKTVDELTPGALVGRVIVTDADDTSGFTFEVSDNRFEVLNDTLKLKAGAQLAFDTEETVTLNITVKDSSGNVYTESDIVINVNDLNEPPYGITLSNESVDENAAGAIVGELNVMDPDANETYTFSVDDERFEVDGVNLKLKNDESLDYETTPMVALNVTVMDSAANTYTQPFTITVNDINEAPTDITLSNSLVMENVPGAVIGDISIVDPDKVVDGWDDVITEPTTDSDVEVDDTAEQPATNTDVSDTQPQADDTDAGSDTASDTDTPESEVTTTTDTTVDTRTPQSTDVVDTTPTTFNTSNDSSSSYSSSDSSSSSSSDSSSSTDY